MLRALEQRLGWIVGKTQEGETLKLTPIEQALTHDGFKERVREAQAFVNANPLVPLDRSFVAWGTKGKGIFSPSFTTIDFQDLSGRFDELAREAINSSDFANGRPVLALFVIKSLTDVGPQKGFPRPNSLDLRRQHNINKEARKINNSSDTALFEIGVRPGSEKVELISSKEPHAWGLESVFTPRNEVLQEAISAELNRVSLPQDVVAILRAYDYRVTPVIRIPSDTLEFSDRDFREIRKAS